MPKTSERRSRGPIPSAEQRLFVCAASAVGLTPEQICREFPACQDGLTKVTPESLARLFPDELKVDAERVAQLVVFRVLQDALRGDFAAELAVFESLGDWRKLPPMDARQAK
jgi:hypothetical protein